MTVQTSRRQVRAFIRFALPILIGWLTGSIAHATNPAVSWEQIETPHFIIVFDSKQRPLGELYAHFAEQAFTGVSPTFGLWPDKTAILIDDSTDDANGSASGYPYPMITAFPVLPTSLDSISDYGNWGLELLTHEYTHILTFEPATGFMRPLRWVFGSIIRPNGLLPRWYLEGLAVELETRYSSFGRLRSANYLSIARAMVEENTLRREDIARINEASIPDWLGGGRAYLMGALLWDEMIRLQGDSIIGKLNVDYSRRMPFFINGPAEKYFGLDYSQLLAKTYDRVEESSQKQIAAVEKAGKEDETPFDQVGDFNHSPIVSPDGTKLAYVGKDINVGSFIAVINRAPAKGSAPSSFSESGPGVRLITGEDINRLNWTPDSKALIYDAIGIYDRQQRFSHYSDLWRVDLATKKKIQLTHAMRAREPVLSPKGRWIVFVQNTPGSTRLSVVHSDGTDLHVLYTPPAQTRIARPEFLSSDEVIFSEKQKDGSEIFKIIHPTAAHRQPRIVLKDYQPVHYPHLTSEGLLFVSDRSGIANLYLADRGLKTARAVTDTTTRVMTGELDKQTGDLIYSRLMADGPLVVSTPRKSWEKTPVTLPQVGPLVDSQYPEYKAPQTQTQNKVEDYNPWPFLIPRYWMPYFAVIPYGTYFSASTSAADPAGQHAYSLTTSYDTLTNKPSFLGLYARQFQPFQLMLLGQDYYEYIYNGSFPRHSTLGDASGSFFIPGLGNEWKGSLGAGYYQSQLFGTTLVRTGVHSSISWDNTEQRGMQISPEKGGSTTLAYTRYLSGLGNIEYDQTEFRGSYFFSKWLPERHVLAFFGNAFVAPRLASSLFGQTTTNGVYQIAPTQRGFIMRGYGPGEFIGRNMLQGTFEYRFPLWYSYRGYGTAPVFFRRWHGAVFADALSLDGYSYNFSNSTYQTNHLGRQYFVGTGVEAKCDTTLFYQYPVQLILGLYYGANAEANPYGLFPFIGFGL